MAGSRSLMRSMCWRGTAWRRSAISATSPTPRSTTSRRRRRRPRSAPRSPCSATASVPRRCSTWRSRIAGEASPTVATGRSDYGSPLRDAAVVVTLAAEGDAGKPILVSATERVGAARKLVTRTSTQEDAWLVLAARALGKQNVSLDVDGDTRKSGRSTRPTPRPTSRRASHHHQYRRYAGRYRGHGERRADDAGARGRSWLRARAELPHSRRRRRRSSLAKQNDRFVVVLKVTEPQPQFARRRAHRLHPGRLRDRQSAARVIGRYRHAALDRQRGDAGAYRVPRRSLHRRLRPQHRRPVGVHRGLCRARGVAGRLCAAASDVEDMYRPDRFGRTGTGTVKVQPAK